MGNTDNSAKFAFYYMLSLVALIAMAISTGTIIFQIINKSITDVLNLYQGSFSPDGLKFAISALIIAAPIFYICAFQIYKNLFSGHLDKDSGIRRWLTYFILFVSSVVTLVWLIITINNFLNGELTLKFALKAITAIGIAAAIFMFYFYDIRRTDVREKKDRVIRWYFYGSLIFIAAVFIAGLFFVESPAETRNRKFDNAVLEDFSNIDGAISTYYNDNGQLPENLDVLKNDFPYVTDDTLKDNAANQVYGYKVKDDKTYELCATFRTTNKNDNNAFRYNFLDRWPHDAGAQCLSQVVRDYNGKPFPMPVR